MYNGIGLTTPRGSGTNGYVVRNLSHVQPPSTKKKQRYDDIKESSIKGKKPNEELLLHDRKRQIEVDCMKLRLKLEDEDLKDADIDKKVDEFRQSMLESFDQVKPQHFYFSLQEHETHLLQAAKNEENLKFAKALGIKQGDSYIEGEAFDREVQERKKLERMEKRRIEMEERMKLYEQREKEYQRMKKGRRREDWYDKEKKIDSRGRSRSTYRSVSPHRRRSASRSPSPSARNKRQRHSSSYSRSRSPHHRRKRSRSPSYSRSRSRSPSYSRSRSPSYSRSRSRSPSYSRSRSRSPSGSRSLSD
ncbi:hypothetical protein BJ944DRAFT_164345 [Cunninghamella echinulata]|nr:hypothetical protein BJ944DRAFT_164345 [Cunninghamella echinulata]